jgi:hypothetical protein
MSKLDLDLLGGDFLEGILPSDKQFLSKYFSSPTERLFLSYYLAFDKISKDFNIRIFYRNFIDHTGYYCSEQWFHYLLKKVKIILGALSKAEKDMNLDELEKIKTGKYKAKI